MKIKGLLIAVMLVGGSYAGVYAYNFNKPAKEVFGEGKTEGYETVKEMESASTLIVVGKRISNSKTVLYEDGDLGGYTLGDFEVSKIIKNTTGDDLKTGEVLPIFENAVEHTTILGERVKTNVNGYNLMKEGKRYILFLQESGSDPGVYIPLSGTFGKVPLESPKGDVEIDNPGQINKNVILEAQEKYKAEK